MNNAMVLKELQYVQYSSGASEDGSPKSGRHNFSQEKINRPLKLDVSDKKWFIASSQCQMAKLKELHSVDSAFINKKDFFTGYSALHWASKQGKSELVHWLCDSSADVNLKSNGGYTPLHMAVMNGHAAIVDILISDYDADINIRDHSGRKPAYYTQTDTPNWLQRALRANQPVDMNRLDPLSPTGLDSHNANLSVMHSRPISRSWGSFKYEAGAEEEAKRGSDQRDNGVRNRTKSLLQSFRKLRHKDRMRSKDAGQKLKSDDRSKSVPEVCYTPRTRAKMLHIEHPHDFHGAIKDGKECFKKNGDINANRDTGSPRCDPREPDGHQSGIQKSIGSPSGSEKTIRTYPKRGIDSGSPDTERSIDTNSPRNTNRIAETKRGISESGNAHTKRSTDSSSPTNARRRINPAKTEISSPSKKKSNTNDSDCSFTETKIPGKNIEMDRNEHKGALTENNTHKWPVSTLV